jgi:hypothetical protein
LDKLDRKGILEKRNSDGIKIGARRNQREKKLNSEKGWKRMSFLK